MNGMLSRSETLQEIKGDSDKKVETGRRRTGWIVQIEPSTYVLNACSVKLKTKSNMTWPVTQVSYLVGRCVSWRPPQQRGARACYVYPRPSIVCGHLIMGPSLTCCLVKLVVTY